MFGNEKYTTNGGIMEKQKKYEGKVIFTSKFYQNRFPNFKCMVCQEFFSDFAKIFTSFHLADNAFKNGIWNRFETFYVDSYGCEARYVFWGGSDFGLIYIYIYMSRIIISFPKRCKLRTIVCGNTPKNVWSNYYFFFFFFWNMELKISEMIDKQFIYHFRYF